MAGEERVKEIEIDRAREKIRERKKLRKSNFN